MCHNRYKINTLLLVLTGGFMAADQKTTIQFTATLTREPDSSATFIAIPVNVFEIFGIRGRVPVAGTLNGSAFRSSIFPYGGVHYLGVNRDLRESTGLKAGDLVDVVMQYDAETRVITPPEDLAKTLSQNAQALKNWKKLSYSHQREYIDAIEKAVKSETRSARIEQTVSSLITVIRHEKK